MPDVQAELKRKDAGGALVNWTLVTDASSATGLSDPVSDGAARAALGAPADAEASSGNGTIIALLKALRTLLNTLATQTDGLEGFTDGIEGLLTTIRDNADTVESLLTTLSTKDFATQTTLAGVLAAVDELEARVGEVAASPTANTVQDRLKGIKSTLDTIQTNTDTVETLLTNIGNNTDGLEGFTDGIETLLTSINGAVDGVETLLTTIRDNADTVESQLTTLNAKDFATQTTLAAVLAAVDGLEGQLTALQTELAQKTEPADQQHVIIDSGTTTITDGGGSITVDAVDLDIRNLTAAQDKVDIGMFNGVVPIREFTGSLTTTAVADIIASTEVKGNWISMQLSGTWTGSVQLQGSNNNVDWQSVSILAINSTANGGSNSISSNGVYVAPAPFRYFRARVTSTGTGTVDVTVEVLALPAGWAPTGLYLVQGNNTHGSTDQGGPVKIGGVAATSTPSAVSGGQRVNAYFDTAGRMAVFDGDSSLTVDAVNLDIRDLAFASDSVTAHQGGTWSVIAAGDVAADAVDSGNPVKIGGPARPIGTPPTQVATNDRVAAWFDLRGRLVVATDAADNFLTNANIQVGDVDVSNVNPVPIADAGGSITVDGTVELGSTTLSALESITVQNGAGGAAVNIQDGGNSITVDAVDLDIRNLNSTDDAVRVVPSLTEITGSAAALNADAVPSTDAQRYRWISVQVTGTFVGTLTFQQSNDNTNFVNMPLWSAASTQTTSGTSTTAAGIFVGPVNGRYVRVRMTAYTSGTANVTAELTMQPGSVPHGGQVDITEMPGNSTLSDSLANPSTTQVGANNLLWDAAGSVWERAISDGSGRLVIADGGTSITVDAVDLDIRNLSPTQDGVDIYGNDSGTDRQIAVNASGHVKIEDGGNSITVDAASLPLPTGAATATNQDPLVKYKIADTDEPLSGAKYYGFTMTTGTWVIMRETTSGNTKLYRYANLGNNGTINGGAAVSYGNATTTNEPWTNRATLTFDYLHNLTGI